MIGDAGSAAQPEAWQGPGSDVPAPATTATASAGARGGSHTGAPADPSWANARLSSEGEVVG